MIVIKLHPLTFDATPTIIWFCSTAQTWYFAYFCTFSASAEFEIESLGAGDFSSNFGGCDHALVNELVVSDAYRAVTLRAATAQEKHGAAISILHFSSLLVLLPQPP